MTNHNTIHLESDSVIQANGWAITGHVGEGVPEFMPPTGVGDRPGKNVRTGMCMHSNPIGEASEHDLDRIVAVPKDMRTMPPKGGSFFQGGT